MCTFSILSAILPEIFIKLANISRSYDHVLGLHFYPYSVYIAFREAQIPTISPFWVWHLKPHENITSKMQHDTSISFSPAIKNITGQKKKRHQTIYPISIPTG